MKFLHTADLHLGRSLHDYLLIEDQALLLENLVTTLEQGGYDAIVIAGDVFDRAIPSPEAVSLFSTFLSSLRSRCPELEILLIAGNHDGAERLGYAGELLSRMGIHIGFQSEGAWEPVLVQRGGQTTAFFLLPFLPPLSLSDADGNPLRAQSALLSEASGRLEAARAAAIAGGADSAVLIAHLFTLGGLSSESERTFLGTAEQVDVGLFSSFDYVALGHLHRSQRVAPNTWYSGSPLAYSFEESTRGKSFLSVELLPRGKAEGGEHLKVSEIPVSPLRPVMSVRGTFASFHSTEGSAARGEEGLKDAYLELRLTDTHLVENPLALLRTRYPYLLSIKQDEALLHGSGKEDVGENPLRRQERKGAAEDFEAFLRELYTEASKEEVALFADMAREVEHETA